MKTTAAKAQCFEFSFPHLETLVQVEESDGDVVVRATRNTFSEQHKMAFIRELASEGFIPEQFRRFPSSTYRAASGIRWIVDYNWLAIDESMIARTRRFMLRLLSAATVLWLAMMVLLFLRAGK